jgi:hypothetical protein
MRKRHFASTMVVVCGLVSLSEPEAMASLTDLQAQVQTVADMRNVGNAMLNWLADQTSAAAQPLKAGTVDFFFYQAISHSDLESLLVPQYIQAVPELDGWGRPYDYRLNTFNLTGQPIMAIRSPGRNAVFEETDYTVGSFDHEQVDQDIVWADGAFVRWPLIPLSNRQAQIQTVEDIRNVGNAMSSWLADQIGGTPQPSEADTVDFFFYQAIAHSDLESLLVPQYIQAVPELDGWGWPYDYRLNTFNLMGQPVMAIRSTGRDGAFEETDYAVGSFDPDQFDQDIVWADGSFVRWPGEPTGLSFYTVSPCRAFDTRVAPELPLQSEVAGSFHFGGICGIPMSAKAVAVNVTVVEPTGAGHVVLFPGGLPVPSTSTINFTAGQVRANNAILPLGGVIGSMGAWATVADGGQVHLIFDVSGYFE